MFHQEPYHFAQVGDQMKLVGGPKMCGGVNQKGGSGSAYKGQFYAVHMNPRELSLITQKYIDDSPMFNPLRKNTVIPTIYDGIVPTGAYLLNNLPTNPDYSKYNSGKMSQADLHCLCQKQGIKIYDEINGKLFPKSRGTLLQQLMHGK